MDNIKSGKLFIITGPSASGKTLIADLVLKEIPEAARIITVTTRQKRPDEIDGKDYFFFSKEKFLRLVKKGAFIEWAEVYGNYYGTLKNETEEKLKNFRAVISVLDVQGTKKFLKLVPNVITIFVTVDNISDLKKRIKERKAGPDDVCRRLGAIPKEYAAKGLCHHIVINENGKIAAAVKKIRKIICRYI